MRHKRPDAKNAQSIIEAAEREMAFTLTLPVTDASGATIVRNCYECFRMLGDALLVAEGVSSQDHYVQIQALLRLQVKTARPIGLIDNLRTLRHSVNYDGYHPKRAEVEDAISLAKACFEPLRKAALAKAVAHKP